jgi:hypothetical protein
MNSRSSTLLSIQYPQFDFSKISEEAYGLVLTQIAIDGTYGYTSIPMNHALNLDTGNYEPILVNDIILEVDGETLSYFSNQQQIESTDYYDVNVPVFFKIFRPSNLKYYNFEVFAVPLPLQLNYVSVDPSLILIAASNPTFVITNFTVNDDSTIVYLYFYPTTSFLGYAAYTNLTISFPVGDYQLALQFKDDWNANNDWVTLNAIASPEVLTPGVYKYFFSDAADFINYGYGGVLPGVKPHPPT